MAGYRIQHLSFLHKGCKAEQGVQHSIVPVCGEGEVRMTRANTRLTGGNGAVTGAVTGVAGVTGAPTMSCECSSDWRWLCRSCRMVTPSCSAWRAISRVSPHALTWQPAVLSTIAAALAGPAAGKAGKPVQKGG